MRSRARAIHRLGNAMRVARRPGPTPRESNISSVFQAPIVGNSRVERVEPLNLVRVVDDRSAIADDGLGRAVTLESVPDSHRHARQTIVIWPQKNLLKLASRRRLGTVVVEDQLNPTEWDRVVDDHPRMEVPRFD